jgi:putative ABC transport system ATP-binding protein
MFERREMGDGAQFLVMTTVLAAEGLYRFFHDGDDEVVALAGVSVSVEPGEVVAVLGPSGSGKSTLLSCLGGLDEPDGGTVTVQGRQMTRRSERERARLRAELVGVLFQSRNLLEHLTVEGNVTLARRLACRQRPALVADDDGLLERLGIAHRRHSLPRELSGGETARAALAVACANEPRVLLADEPTGEVDSTTARTVVGLLRSRADDGAGVVVVTHSDAIARVADTVVHLRDGKVIA